LDGDEEEMGGLQQGERRERDVSKMVDGWWRKV
jgi:hypothetical protein